MRIRVLAAVAFALAASAGWAGAAEIKVFSTIGVQAALEELTPKFEQASGHKLVVTWNTAAVLVKRVQAGEAADVVVLTRQSLDALAKDGKAVAEPHLRKLRHGHGGEEGCGEARHFDTDAFKRALLNAATIAYSDPAHGGASGVYLAKLLERMGIAGEVKAKDQASAAGRQRRRAGRERRGRACDPAGAGSHLRSRGSISSASCPPT